MTKPPLFSNHVLSFLPLQLARNECTQQFALQVIRKQNQSSFLLLRALQLTKSLNSRTYMQENGESENSTEWERLK